MDYNYEEDYGYCPECRQPFDFCYCYDNDPDYDDVEIIDDYDDYDDSMDGDHESALASAGWGTDEDYGMYEDAYDDYDYDDFD